MPLFCLVQSFRNDGHYGDFVKLQMDIPVQIIPHFLVLVAFRFLAPQHINWSIVRSSPCCEVPSATTASTSCWISAKTISLIIIMGTIPTSIILWNYFYDQVDMIKAIIILAHPMNWLFISCHKAIFVIQIQCTHSKATSSSHAYIIKLTGSYPF